MNFLLGISLFCVFLLALKGVVSVIDHLDEDNKK